MAVIGIQEVSAKIGIAVGTIYNQIHANPSKFPPRVLLPYTNKLLWIDSDVDAWLESIEQADTEKSKRGAFGKSRRSEIGTLQYRQKVQARVARERGRLKLHAKPVEMSLSPAHLGAVSRYEKNHGTNWKSSLRRDWARPENMVEQVEDIELLLQIRDGCGLKWLLRYGRNG